MTRDIEDVLKEDIIDRIDNTITIKQITYDGDPELHFVVCALKWVKVGQPLLDEFDNTYVINVIDYATGEIQTSRPDPGARPRKGSVLQIIAPRLYCGTRIVVNNELPKSVSHDIRSAVPFIWLKETIPGNRYPEESSQDFDADLELYFLDEIDVMNSLNAVQRQQGVKPMSALKEAFYAAVEESYIFSRDRGTFERSITRLGRETENGMFKNILDANLGGVYIRPTLTIAKSARCNC